MERQQKILIDGYNVIYADENLRSLMSKDPQEARTGLIALLEKYLEQKQLQVTLVFDGKGRMLDTASIIPGKLQVIFSRTHQNADELIISILEDALNPREYMVVTSDSEDIGRVARNLGAQVLESHVFLSRFASKNISSPTGKEKPDPTDDDISYWLKKFSNSESLPGDEFHD